MKFLYLSTEEELIILKNKQKNIFAELCNKQNQVQPVIEYFQN